MLQLLVVATKGEEWREKRKKSMQHLTIQAVMNHFNLCMKNTSTTTLSALKHKNVISPSILLHGIRTKFHILFSVSNDKNNLYRPTDAEDIQVGSPVHPTSSEETPYHSFDEDSCHSDEDEEARKQRVADSLCQLKVKHNLTRDSICDLARLFRSVGINLPKDPRTILKTDVSPLDDENFIHIGLAVGLRRRILDPAIVGPSKTILLHIHIDGKRLGKGGNNAISLF